MSKNKLRVYNWNTNGTNDIEILNENHEVIEVIPEGCFGINIGSVDHAIIPLTTVLSHIAVSPVCDGQSTLKVLHKYFK